MTAGEGVRAALRPIADWLATTEDGRVRDSRLARDYTVIRPLSLASPLSAETLADITAAIGILNRHALIIASD
jgi:hypothetical protein